MRKAWLLIVIVVLRVVSYQDRPRVDVLRGVLIEPSVACLLLLTTTRQQQSTTIDSTCTTSTRSQGGKVVVTQVRPGLLLGVNNDPPSSSSPYPQYTRVPHDHPGIATIMVIHH